MDILLVDDSVAFDGYSPASGPLGGDERAFASLASALRRRGHDVRVINRCRFSITAEGVQWQTWKDARPETCEALIAYRKPSLLDFPVEAKRRVFWAAGDATVLKRGLNREVLRRHDDAPVVFAGPKHRARCPEELADRARVIEPGVRREYLEAGPMAPAHPPRAVATTHPLLDLDWLLRLWCAEIRPRAPEAELHVYSALLDQGDLGAELPEKIRPILERARAGGDDGVVIKRPLGDPDMAEAYRGARVHLYPGDVRLTCCHTLADTQAVGLPAVTRRIGAAPERIIDGETGFLVPDDEAFLSCAMLLLTDDGIFNNRSATARERQRGRSWDDAAEEFEALLS